MAECKRCQRNCGWCQRKEVIQKPETPPQKEEPAISARQDR